jgi:hypothetical protein
MPHATAINETTDTRGLPVATCEHCDLQLHKRSDGWVHASTNTIVCPMLVGPQ